MRIIALDVHRSFAQTAILKNGKLRDAGKVDLERNRLLQFAKRLKPDDEIIIEATGNTSAIVRLLSPFVGRVIIANPILVRAIAWAKVKTDKIDAAVLAKLHASGFLPEVWVPDEETETRRRVVAERTQLVSQTTRLKNRILHANRSRLTRASCSQSVEGLGWRLSRSPRSSDASSFAEAIAGWTAQPRTTPGGQRDYSDLAIKTALTLRTVFRLALRQTKGLIGSIMKMLEIDLPVPDHTMLSRRACGLPVCNLARIGTRELHLIVDSTGLQLPGIGDCLKHGTTKRRAWRKLHIGIDAGNGEIVASDLTDKDVDDASHVPTLLDQPSSIPSFFAVDHLQP